MLFRSKKKEDMRTIFQWALVPKTHTVYIRPIQTKMDLNVSREMVKAKVLDNQVIKKTYDGHIKNFSKIERVNGGDEVRTIQQEKFLPFKAFIK